MGEKNKPKSQSENLIFQEHFIVWYMHECACMCIWSGKDLSPLILVTSSY